MTAPPDLASGHDRKTPPAPVRRNLRAALMSSPFLVPIALVAHEMVTARARALYEEAAGRTGTVSILEQLGNPHV